MPKQYSFYLKDAVAAEFEQALSDNGFTPETLFAKEVSDFVNSKRNSDADAQKPKVVRILAESAVEVSETKDVSDEGMPAK